MKNPTNTHLQNTIVDLQEALAHWDQIEEHSDPEAEEFRKRTRELLDKLKDQLNELSL
jgi:ElaB/YqjD/DUF883 family membrane-anchored ribosome-binding protein